MPADEPTTGAARGRSAMRLLSDRLVRPISAADSKLRDATRVQVRRVRVRRLTFAARKNPDASNRARQSPRMNSFPSTVTPPIHTSELAGEEALRAFAWRFRAGMLAERARAHCDSQPEACHRNEELSRFPAARPAVHGTAR